MALQLASVDVSRASPQPLTSQIQEAIKREITQGVLHPGTRLPSSRSLADDLRVSRSVVVEAYGQLIAEGYLEALQGSGTRVAHHLAPAPVVSTLLNEGLVPTVRWDLRPAGTVSAHFPHREWAAAYQRAVRSAGHNELDYPPLSGVVALREELARYLGRVRGVRTAARDIMVVQGFAQGLGLLCGALVQTGVGSIAVEVPGHPRQRRFIEKTGLTPVPIPVDSEGIEVGALTHSGVRAVLVTPFHQYPTGVTLSPRRRQALADWARRTGGLVIEDDYDGDFWLERQPPPLAFQRLAPAQVAYAGTVSKSLVPALRLGWLAVPPSLLTALERVRAERDLGSDVLTQLSFAELLRSGAFDRHLRRMRVRYRERRLALAEAVGRHLPGSSTVGSAAGLHAFVRLPPGTDEARFVAAALRRSVLVRGAAEFGTRDRRWCPGLVVGYTSLTPTGLHDAMTELGRCLHPDGVSARQRHRGVLGPVAW
ncbi:PLP-dependent aminotransferase family protein [Streptomyces sp. NBC_00878]|uniref:MocR-like pyridoxine biosynthesis transcription factor PdxR n=1 Tax=Streptomyces sp. NBC_00878 TaxID=2975854 RepID=UPI0022597848|nr:PLP-dependent aminotransferase family protein [Streptomyces sp. NBC_00878]MCX4904517.1 PLP-dependent aminotransferase family protein [Streptomyces sp. NBC_00878]